MFLIEITELHLSQLSAASPVQHFARVSNKTVQERKRMWYSQILAHCKNNADVCSQWSRCVPHALPQVMNRTAIHPLFLSSPGSVLALHGGFLICSRATLDRLTFPFSSFLSVDYFC